MAISFNIFNLICIYSFIFYQLSILQRERERERERKIKERMEVSGQLHALNDLHPAHIEYETGLTPELE